MQLCETVYLVEKRTVNMNNIQSFKVINIHLSLNFLLRNVKISL